MKKRDTFRNVVIDDPKHPHFGESGTLTGKVINLLGKQQAELTLENCVHGEQACFVRSDQIRLK